MYLQFPQTVKWGILLRESKLLTYVLSAVFRCSIILHACHIIVFVWILTVTHIFQCCYWSDMFTGRLRSEIPPALVSSQCTHQSQSVTT